MGAEHPVGVGRQRLKDIDLDIKLFRPHNPILPMIRVWMIYRYTDDIHVAIGFDVTLLLDVGS